MKNVHKTTISKYLLSRLKAQGASHIFGMPGDYALELFAALEQSPLELIAPGNELNSGYAADAYARLKGLGAVMVTYGVGELSVINAIAGAYAERVPVLLIVGAPPRGAAEQVQARHHTIGDYKTTRKMFEPITAAIASITSVKGAASEIDRVITEMLSRQLPGYLSIPQDMVDKTITVGDEQRQPLVNKHECPNALAKRISRKISQAQKPVLIVGREIERLGMTTDVLKLIQHFDLDFYTTIMGKGVLNELHPKFKGVYTKQGIDADFTITIGTFITDLNTFMFSDDLLTKAEIKLFNNAVAMEGSVFENVSAKALLNKIAGKSSKYLEHTPRHVTPLTQNDTLNQRNFIPALEQQLQPYDMLISEAGNSFFSCLSMQLPMNTIFLNQTYYASIGYSLAATVGAAIAEPNRRSVLVIGDGSIQLSVQEISTMVRYGLRPIIIVLNNYGYTLERILKDGAFNDVHNWQYADLATVFGGPKGKIVTTIGEFTAAIEAVNKSQTLSIIEIPLQPDDVTPLMQQLLGGSHE